MGVETIVSMTIPWLSLSEKKLGVSTILRIVLLPSAGWSCARPLFPRFMLQLLDLDSGYIGSFTDHSGVFFQSIQKGSCLKSQTIKRSTRVQKPGTKCVLFPKAKAAQFLKLFSQKHEERNCAASICWSQRKLEIS